MATEYLISRLEAAYQALTEARLVARELERDRVLEPGMVYVTDAQLAILTALERIAGEG